MLIRVYGGGGYGVCMGVCMHVLDTHWLHAGYDEGAHRATAAQSSTAQACTDIS